MKKSVLTLTGLFFLLAATAQTTIRRMDAPRTINLDNQPLFIIDDSVVTDMSYMELNPENITSVTVLKDSTAVASYGPKARNGVIIIHTNHKPMFLNLEGILDQYNITGASRKLRVCIDNVLVKNSNRIALNPSEILRAEVITDICWKSPAEAGPEETYINLVTKKAATPTP